ncbi:MAG: YnbE family lipoprotein [Pseudomonadota bacterium]
MTKTNLIVPSATVPLFRTRFGGGLRRCGMIAGAVLVSAGLSGCIQIAAPDEPIVIELNINIRQEVIYRLAEDAGNTIDENADIF